MSQTYFGQIIPVSGLNLGFAGKVSRLGERVVTSRQVLSTTPNAIAFGAPVVIIPNGSGGGDTVVSVADYVLSAGSGGQGGTFTAAKLAGVAIAEVLTQTNYTASLSPYTAQSGSYIQGNMCELLERGSITVPINVGTPASQGTVYVRVAANASIPAGVVGGFEAAADGSNTVALTNVVFRTGVLDSNNVAEITLLSRVAA